MIAEQITNRIDHFEDHPNVLVGLKGLIETAQQLHSEERTITLLSVRLVGLLIEQNGAGNSWMSQERFAWHIGLTPNQFWKRSQTYRVLKAYPQFEAMIKNGETCVSHVSMLAKTITDANAEVLADGIRYKSTREVRDLVALVQPDGSRLTDEDAFLDIRLRLTKAQVDVLERARDVLSHGGHVSSSEELVMKALSDLLERKDPLKKAQRAAAKEIKAAGDTETETNTNTNTNTHTAYFCSSSKKETSGMLFGETESSLNECPSLKKGPDKATRDPRPPIPAALKHRIWLRDQGECTHVDQHGFQCRKRMMLEIDHLIPWAQGGQHTFENIALKCREHNQWAADQVYGQSFMEQFRHQVCS